MKFFEQHVYQAVRKKKSCENVEQLLFVDLIDGFSVKKRKIINSELLFSNTDTMKICFQNKARQ